MSSNASKKKNKNNSKKTCGKPHFNYNQRMTAQPAYSVQVFRNTYYNRYESSNLSVSVDKGADKAIVNIRITPFNWSAHHVERSEAARIILAMRKTQLAQILK
jgi:hypothetical protein